MSLTDNWIITVFKINPQLDKLAYKAEKEATERARRRGYDTFNDVSVVLESVNRKNAYFNLRVIYNSFLDALSDEEMRTVNDVIGGVSITDIARSSGIHRNSVYRTLKKAFKKCENVLGALDYSEKSMEKEFLWLLPVAELMQRNVA